MWTAHTSLGDRDLVERIRIGESTAEGEFARRYLAPLSAMMSARARNREDAEDLVQDTLLAALQALRRGAIASSERLDAFVNGTARNIAKSYFRSRERRPLEVPLPDDLPAAPAEPSWAHEERLALALSVLARQPGLDGAILELTLVGGLSPAEIGQTLRLPPGLVRTHKSRAAHRLALELRVTTPRSHPMG